MAEDDDPILDVLLKGPLALTLGKMAQRVTRLHLEGKLSVDAHSAALVLIGGLMAKKAEVPRLVELALVALDQLLGTVEQKPATEQPPSEENAEPRRRALAEWLNEPEPDITEGELRKLRLYEQFVAECRKHEKLPGAPAWLQYQLEQLTESGE